MVYLVTYQLINPGQNWAEVHKDIESLGKYAKPMKGVYIVETNQEINEVQRISRKHMDDNDFVLVVQVPQGKIVGWLPEEARTDIDKLRF